MTIIDRLKLILERVNLTPGNFADKIGVAPATISHILSGRNKYPSAEVMLRLHETFPDIDLNWLLTGEGTLVKDDPDSMFTGSLFGDNLLNATKSTTESENRKENSLETAKNTDNPIVKQEIIYKEKPVRKIAEIRIFFDDGTYETFTPNK
ncbi:MAG: helix-turn-helix transcriptional regulator [Bacteroidaceae bacterium]|nr:helix-turn-helix transcriptional regulator [Bacteroidaceae bacterium]